MTVNYSGQTPGEPKNNGMGLAAMICGIAALVIAWIPCLNLLAIPLVLVAIGLGIAGWVTANNKPDQKPLFAIIGIALGVLAIPAFFLSYFVLANVSENVGGEFGNVMGRTGVIMEKQMEAQSLYEAARQQGVDEATISDAEAAFDEKMENIGESEGMGRDEVEADAEAALEALRSQLGVDEGAADDQFEPPPVDAPTTDQP